MNSNGPGHRSGPHDAGDHAQHDLARRGVGVDHRRDRAGGESVEVSLGGETMTRIEFYDRYRLFIPITHIRQFESDLLTMVHAEALARMEQEEELQR